MFCHVFAHKGSIERNSPPKCRMIGFFYFESMNSWWIWINIHEMFISTVACYNLTSYHDHYINDTIRHWIPIYWKPIIYTSMVQRVSKKSVHLLTPILTNDENLRKMNFCRHNRNNHKCSLSTHVLECQRKWPKQLPPVLAVTYGDRYCKNNQNGNIINLFPLKVGLCSNYEKQETICYTSFKLNLRFSVLVVSSVYSKSYLLIIALKCMSKRFLFLVYNWICLFRVSCSILHWLLCLLIYYHQFSSFVFSIFHIWRKKIYVISYPLLSFFKLNSVYSKGMNIKI